MLHSRVGMGSKPVSFLSEEEYLALDRAAEVRSEYHGGQMFAMSGGTLLHSKIAVNLASEFSNALRGKDCDVFGSDTRVLIRKPRASVYPDLSVACGKLADETKDILEVPALVAEVRSPSTEKFDRGAKFSKYRNIESLREYMLVSQDAPQVELFSRQASGAWLLTEARGLESSIRIESPGCEIPLAGIYYRVSLPTPEPEDGAPLAP